MQFISLYQIHAFTKMNNVWTIPVGKIKEFCIGWKHCQWSDKSMTTQFCPQKATARSAADCRADGWLYLRVWAQTRPIPGTLQRTSSDSLYSLVPEKHTHTWHLIFNYISDKNIQNTDLSYKKYTNETCFFFKSWTYFTSIY